MMREARLLPHAGNALHRRHVLRLHGGHKTRGRERRQRGKRHLRPHAAHADEPLEQSLLLQREKSVQRQRIVAHLQERVHLNRCPASGSFDRLAWDMPTA